MPQALAVAWELVDDTSIADENKLATIKEMDERLADRMVETMKAVLTSIKNQNPIVYQKTVNDVLDELSGPNEETRSKNKE